MSTPKDHESAWSYLMAEAETAGAQKAVAECFAEDPSLIEALQHAHPELLWAAWVERQSLLPPPVGESFLAVAVGVAWDVLDVLTGGGE